jgi:hypothetical protein
MLLILFFFKALKQRFEEKHVLRTLCFVLLAAQNPFHAFPNAACGGYKQLHELSCLNGNSMKHVFQKRSAIFSSAADTPPMLSPDW